MKPCRRKLRLAAVAVMAAVAVVTAACKPGSPASSSGSTPTTRGTPVKPGTPVKGGTVSVALAEGGYNWIFPFNLWNTASNGNIQQFQWLFYRPLYMFGNNTNSNVAVNYPLSPATAPVYSNGGKTVTINFKGWKWSDGETVGADSFIFFMNMVEAEKANWVDYAPGLLPDNVVSYKATSPTQVVMQLNRPYSSLWWTYNQLAEIKPMPEAWDVTSLGGKAGSGGCLKDSAKDGWVRCKAVYRFLYAQSKNAATYATSPLWSVVDGPWKLKTFSTSGDVTMVPNPKYSGSPKPKLSAIKFVPFGTDAAEYKALKTGQVDVGYIPTQDLPQKPANAVVPATDPVGSRYNLQPFYTFAISYAQANFNNPQVGFMVRQLYMRQALQEVFDQPGIIKSIWRGYAVLGAGPAPTSPPGNQWIPPIENENNGQGPYPFSIAKAKSTLKAHGWSEVNGVMTCQDPAMCGQGIAKGQQAKFTYIYASGPPFTAQWQTYKSDARSAGIDINLVGKTFNTVLGEGRPCAPMGPRCRVQVLTYGGWGFNGPGFEPTGESLFATGANSNIGNYSDPQMDSLIDATQTSSAMSTFDQYATYGARQLPFIWAPQSYSIQAVSKRLRGVSFNALWTLLPEYWHLTK